MSKTAKKTLWYCSSCGNESSKWMGRCPACGEWNTMIEAPVSDTHRKPSSGGGVSSVARRGETSPMKLSDIGGLSEERISLSCKELDRLLGGGIVHGSLVLIGGEPGIGKSTLSLQIPLGCKGLTTLYVSGEESAKQVKMRAERLGGDDSSCFIFCETCIENVISEAEKVMPSLMIVDSVQTMYTETVESAAGSVSQIKEVTSALLRFAKESGVPVILIGHITKDGYIAGPKILEHIVDVVLQFEGDNKNSYRVLRSIKNRFGATSEVAVFEMTGRGLKEVENPSELLIPMHGDNLSGSAIAVMLDGTRPFMLEVQALVSSAVYGTAQRVATGFDTRRLNMLLAVLEKRAGFKLSAKDVFLNMSGGFRVNDPACDLAVICAVLSSNFDFVIPSDVCFAAEIGLSGEVRPVAQTDRLIAEASRHAFRRIFVSSYSGIGDEKLMKGNIKVEKVPDVPSLVRVLFK